MARSTAHFVRASVCAESGRWDGVGRASSDVEKMRRVRARATFVALDGLGVNLRPSGRYPIKVFRLVEGVHFEPRTVYRLVRRY